MVVISAASAWTMRTANPDADWQPHPTPAIHSRSCSTRTRPLVHWALSKLRGRRLIHASAMDVSGDPAMLIALSVLRSSSARSEIGCRLPASRQANGAEAGALPAPSGCFDSTAGTIRQVLASARRGQALSIVPGGRRLAVTSWQERPTLARHRLAPREAPGNLRRESHCERLCGVQQREERAVTLASARITGSPRC
jgi:hypothetical protein